MVGGRFNLLTNFPQWALSESGLIDLILGPYVVQPISRTPQLGQPQIWVRLMGGLEPEGVSSQAR